MGSTIKKPIVREAKTKEFQRIAELAHDAFILDPVFNYFGSVQEGLKPGNNSQGSRGLGMFTRFLLKTCHRSGGRITVVVNPPDSGTSDSNEEIVAAALWLPPNKRIALWHVLTLVRSGVFSVLRGWGLNGLMRIGFEYLDTSHAAMVKGYKAKGIKESPDASWYLQLMMTDPAHQGKGYMSLLVREAFSNSPSATFTLEATTSKSRDQYVHLGFEVVTPMRLGVKKVNASGLPTSGKDAVGVECYSMVKWSPERS